MVILRDDPHNRPFAERLRRTSEGRRRSIHLLLEPDFHEKGLLGDDYSLDGSMNFTFRGITVNDEHLVYRTDLSAVAERHQVMERRWRAKLS